MSDRMQFRRKSFSSQGVKGKSTVISKKRLEKNLPVIENGRDVTPKPLNPDIYTAGPERQLSIYDVSCTDRSEVASTDTLINVFRVKSFFKTEEKTKLSASFYTASIHCSNFIESLVEDDEERTLESTPDTIQSTSDDFYDDDWKEPQHVNLSLNETNTHILLEIPSATAVKDSDEGNNIEEDNQQYEFLTSGKGRNRKVLHAEVQTVPVLLKSRATAPEKIKYLTNSTFASNWEMYDTYQEAQEEASESDEESDELDIEVHKLNEMSSLDSYRSTEDEKQWLKLIKNQKFLEAACVIERLLANNCYNEQQKRFIGLSDPSEFRENIEYKYTLNLLWTFSNSEVLGRSINAVQWNPLNKDLLAVGYGKFYFTVHLTGLVYIWNIKNPVQPERKFDFTRSVTALSFSNSDPNLLAVGTFNGHVVVINIVSRVRIIIAENIPSNEPVRDLLWRPSQYELNNNEQICAAFDDGRVVAYSLARKLQGQEIMRVPKGDGKLKGYQTIEKCSNLSLPVSRYIAALFVEPHPSNETIYFVGTNKGIIHRCSTNYFNQHLDHFLAHDGPVYSMKFSPFTSKFFATCGDDWTTRIWSEDIHEPIVDLYTTMQSIQGLDWSPTHSTILVTIVGSNILTWDFQRKIYGPQSVTPSPTGSRNTVVQFTDTGRCLVVGDIDGNVHVFSLEDMPFPAFFQQNLLYESLFRALSTNQLLVNKLKKAQKMSKEK